MSFDLSNIIQQLADNSGVTPELYRWRNVFVISGPGGSRVDAVTTWLNMQPALTNAVSLNWRIEPATGRTASHNYNLWFNDRFSFSKNYNEDLDWLKQHYDPRGFVIAQKYHNPNYLDRMMPDELRHYIKYLYIAPDKTKSSLVDLVWEFTIKTLLQTPWESHIHGFGKDIEYSHDLIINHVKVLFRNHLVIQSHFTADVKFISYNDLVSPNGSYKLCEILGFETSEYQHAIWERGVAAGKSPSTIQSHNKIWTRSEFEDLYDEVVSTINP